ncbi:MAG: hypothetical protein ACUVQ0_02420 [Thermoproteota archaeon]
MGGSKKLRLSQLEKRQQKEREEKAKAERSKSERKVGEVTLQEERIFEKLKGSRVITPYIVFSQTGLKMGEAKRLLKHLEERGLLRRANVENRVPIYIPVSEAA